MIKTSQYSTNIKSGSRPSKAVLLMIPMYYLCCICFSFVRSAFDEKPLCECVLCRFTLAKRLYIFFHAQLTQLSMQISLLINMQVPTIVGIFIFISKEIFMLNYF